MRKVLRHNHRPRNRVHSIAGSVFAFFGADKSCLVVMALAAMILLGRRWQP